MSSLANQVHIIGHLGADPEVKTFETGKKKANFRVAAREAYLNEAGKRIETTEWINVVAWEGLAQIAEKYMHKGKQVAIRGRIHTRDYMDANNQKKYITEVIATEILLLGGKPKEAEAA